MSDEIYNKCFVDEQGNRMPLKIFHEVCKEGDWVVDDVVKAALDRGWRAVVTNERIEISVAFNNPIRWGEHKGVKVR